MTVSLPHPAPDAEASAHDIIDHLVAILQAVRSPPGKVAGDKNSLAARRHDMLDALRVFTLTPFKNADEKWRTIAASPKAMAIIKELRDYEDEDEYVHEVECSDRIVRDIEHKTDSYVDCAMAPLTRNPFFWQTAACLLPPRSSNSTGCTDTGGINVSRRI
jgi:hypothetical protein